MLRYNTNKNSTVRVGICSRPRKDSVQKLSQNRTGSSWFLLPPRERLCAETRSETLGQQPPHTQQLNGASRPRERLDLYGLSPGLITFRKYRTPLLTLF